MARKRKPPSDEILHPDDVVRLQEETRGRNLASASIAAHHGIGMGYAKKTHADERVEPKGLAARSLLSCFRTGLKRRD